MATVRFKSKVVLCTGDAVQWHRNAGNKAKRIRNLLSLRKKVKANIVRQFLLSEMPGMNVRPLLFCAVRCFNVGVILGYVWLVNDSHIDEVVFVYITPIFGY